MVLARCFCFLHISMMLKQPSRYNPWLPTYQYPLDFQDLDHQPPISQALYLKDFQLKIQFLIRFQYFQFLFSFDFPIHLLFATHQMTYSPAHYFKQPHEIIYHILLQTFQKSQLFHFLNFQNFKYFLALLDLLMPITQYYASILQNQVFINLHHFFLFHSFFIFCIFQCWPFWNHRFIQLILLLELHRPSLLFYLNYPYKLTFLHLLSMVQVMSWQQLHLLSMQYFHPQPKFMKKFRCLFVML